MTRRTIVIVLLSCLLSAPTWASQLAQRNKGRTSQRAAYVARELLVKYRPSRRAAAAGYFRSRWGVLTLRRFRRIAVEQLKLPEDMSVEEALEIFRSDPDVEYAEPNYLRYLTATIPDDPFFSSLWGLENTGQVVNGTSGTPGADIDAPAAWDITTGSSRVVVAVLDSGVDYNHPDLRDNIWTNEAELNGTPGVDDDGNGYVDDIRGWDFVGNDNNPMDYNNHGTHVAGTIAAEGNNNTGIAGVTWATKIMVLRFVDQLGSGSVADEIAGIDYAIENGAVIINASFASFASSTAEEEAITRAMQAGILFVAAAGNESWDNDNSTLTTYPSSYDLDNIIAVAASDQNDNLASFSNFGATTVDVAAPGMNIYSSKPPAITITVFEDDFESGLGNWSLNSPWGLSNATFFSPSHSLTDSPGGNYSNNIDVSARNTIALDLSAKEKATLTFKLRGESAAHDLLFVETATNPGGPWTNRNIIIDSNQIFDNGISGSSNGQWLDAAVELDTLDGKNEGYFRFRFQTDASINADGWYIDDVTIAAADTTYPNPQSQYYQFLQGTSMATPHVSGLSALVWSVNLAQTFAQVKQVILNSVEVKSSLEGLLLTGGRINALNALDLVHPPSLYFPHVDSGGLWETEIGLINTSPDRSVNGIIRGYDDLGEQVAEMTVTLASYARKEIIVGQEFPGASDIKYFILRVDSNDICGYTKFYVNGRYRAAVPAVQGATYLQKR